MAELGEALGVVGSGDVEMADVGTGRRPSPFEKVQKAVEKVVRQGFSATQVLIQVRLFLPLR